LLGLQDLLDDLLFLDEESTHNPVSHTASASGTTVCTSDGLLCLGQMLAAHASGLLDAEEQRTAVTAPEDDDDDCNPWLVLAEHTASRPHHSANLCG
jgi:hypothetical protein